jgi:valyl-tRNA synthetase
MGVSPAMRVALYIAADREATEPQLAYLTALAKISTATFVTPLPEANAPVAVTSLGKWMLDIAVDVREERERLSKEIARLNAEISRSSAKLGNASFVDKAPAAVVEQEKRRLADFSAKVGQMQARLAQLK